MPSSGSKFKLRHYRLLQPAQTPVTPTSVDAEVLSLGALPGESILLVEDDAGVREYAIGALEDLGYQVYVSESGAEALRMIEKIDRVDLLFTDVILGGGINGRQLSEEIYKLKPNLPVLFTTGYTRNAIVHQGRLDAGVHLLSKPYTQKELGEKIRFIIHGPPQDLRKKS